MKTNIAVVIPSYNESKNIALLVVKISAVLRGVKIIIVDDSSILENKKLQKIVKENKNITLISRFKKLGRGTAVIAGFKEVLRDKKIDYIFEMDSDLAHDPTEMTRFINKIKEGNSDLVIGSRYIPGGKIINVSKFRVILSKIINIYLRLWLRVNVSDYTGGFRLYKKSVVSYLLKIELKSKGFITLSEILYKLTRNGFRIAEVPISLNDRKHGKSNVDIKELTDSLFFITMMRIKDVLARINYRSLTLILIVLLFAFGIRVATLNQMGRTWDEPEYIEQGYKLDELIKKGDFNNSYFYTTYDHPPLAKYLYGLTAHLDVDETSKDGKVIFKYDYTYSRLLSIFFSVLSVLLVILIGKRYISFFAGIVAGIIFSTLPFFVGLSQLVATESMLMFFFTASVYSFIRLIEHYSVKKLLLTGVLTGLALQVKQSNLLLFPVYLIIYIAWYYDKKRKLRLKIINKTSLSIILILLISILVFFTIWPTPIFHFKEIQEINNRIWMVKTSPPEVFFGRLMLVPVIYYPVFFFITTPFVIILFFFLGLFDLRKEKNWVLYSILIWFLLPFMQSFYAWKQHGLRYIIEIYAPLSLIAAVGFVTLLNKISRKSSTKILGTALLSLYMISLLLQIKPYYLDYYNLLVGGATGVYQNKSFQLGWWGQGLREAGEYVKNLKPNSTIGVFVSPLQSFPKIENQKLIYVDPSKQYDMSKKYDYAVVNYFHVLREGFDDDLIKQDYKLIHKVTADGATLVDIYQRK
ncbi:glycosyltransferase [Patescibacteria group bacterium]|nr:glycosyltransferase [Patescibacteria group bacterium]